MPGAKLRSKVKRLGTTILLASNLAHLKSIIDEIEDKQGITVMIRSKLQGKNLTREYDALQSKSRWV